METENIMLLQAANGIAAAGHKETTLVTVKRAILIYEYEIIDQDGSTESFLGLASTDDDGLTPAKWDTLGALAYATEVELRSVRPVEED